MMRVIVNYITKTNYMMRPLDGWPCVHRYSHKHSIRHSIGAHETGQFGKTIENGGNYLGWHMRKETGQKERRGKVNVQIGFL